MCNSSAITTYLANKVTQDIINDEKWDELHKILPALNDLAVFAHYVKFKVNNEDSFLGPIFPWDAMTLLQRRNYLASLVKCLPHKKIFMLYSEAAERFIADTPTDKHIDSIETHLAWESVWKSHKEIEVLKNIFEKKTDIDSPDNKKSYSELKAGTWKGNTLYVAENGIIGDLLLQLVPTEHKINWFPLPNGDGNPDKNIFRNRDFHPNHPVLNYLATKIREDLDQPSQSPTPELAQELIFYPFNDSIRDALDTNLLNQSVPTLLQNDQSDLKVFGLMIAKQVVNEGEIFTAIKDLWENRVNNDFSVSWGCIYRLLDSNSQDTYKGEIIEFIQNNWDQWSEQIGKVHTSQRALLNHTDRRLKGEENQNKKWIYLYEIGAHHDCDIAVNRLKEIRTSDEYEQLRGNDDFSNALSFLIQNNCSLTQSGAR